MTKNNDIKLSILDIGTTLQDDSVAALALRRSREAVSNYNFTEQFYEMLYFFNGNFPDDHRFKHITPVAKDENDDFIPEIFMLGSINGGVEFAIEEGLGFVFAAHINPELAIDTLKGYHVAFKPSEKLKAPKGIYSTIVITAETDEEAEYLAGPVQLFWARLQNRDMHSLFATAEEASNHEYSSAELTAIEYNKDRLKAFRLLSEEFNLMK